MSLASLRATPGAAAPVLADLSAVSRAEIEAAGCYPDDMAPYVVARIREHGGYVILNDGEPIAVYGFVPFEYGPHRGSATWFLAAERFFASGARATRFARRTLAAHAARRRGALFCASSSPHPQARRWLGLLGFEDFEDHGTCFISQYRVLPSRDAA